MRAYRSHANLRAGPSSLMATATAPRKAGPASRIAAQPMPFPRSGPILVLATVDSERYTKVDIADTLDNGAIIRKRILNKLGIWNQNEQEDSLIYETEFGALAIGEPLTDRQLSTISYERGDDRASLAFLVRRPTHHLLVPGNPPAQEVQVEGEAGDSDFSSGTVDDAAHKRRRRRQNISPDEVSSSRPTLPTRLDVTNLDVLREYVTPSPSPLTPTRALKPSKSVEFLRRGVRPLPPIPAPITAPHNLKGSTSNANFHRSNGEPRLGGSISHSPSRASPHETPTQHSSTRRVERDNQSPSNIPRLQPPQNNQSDANDPPRLKGPKSFEWKRGNLIGTGKYGPVYMALDSKTKSIIAVKQIEIPRVRQSDPGATSVIEALKQESEILQGLDHKNIVKYLRLEETPSVLNIFMEYVPGGTIRSCLTQYGTFAETITKSFTAQVLDGLAYLHSKQLVHRDLKAENILVEPNGICKISDFAISKHADNDGFVFTALQGSLFWMAPEVINTQKQGYNSKVDIWSLGCLILEMWTGVRPWAGLKARDVILKLYISELAPPIPEGTRLTDTAADLHKKCFSMNPEDRPTASQLQKHPYLILPTDWKFAGFKSKQQDIIQEGTPEKEVPLLEMVTLRLPSHLDRFRIYSSKGESARQWLDASQEDILDYVSSQDGLTLDDKALCTDWVKSGVIYERFTIYIYEQLKAYHLATQATTDYLSELKNCIQMWSTWDVVKAISQHHVVSDRLRAFPVWKQEERLQRIVALDIDSICARLYLILQEREQYQMLVDLPKEPSQMVLNLLQTLLDSPSLDPSFRSPFMNALLRVSRKTGLYPEVLLQNRVTLEGEDAVAAGQFGDVWKGTFEGQKVAVKVLKLYVQSDVTKHLKKVSYETLIWRQLRHRNILPFLCLYYVNNNRARIGLVSPWMENGNVQEYLHQNPDADRVSLVRDVAKGLEYLHTMQPSIVHGDLKAVNILITDTRRACLADFGLSTASQSQVLKHSSSLAGGAGGTSRWTAPELLNGTQDMNNIRSDVYAFGCVLYEIFSGNIPFHDINIDYPVILKVIQGIRPPRPSHCIPSGASSASLGLDDHLWSIVEECWLSEPTERPTMSDIITRLPKRPISTAQLDGIRQYSPDQDLIPWAISDRDARTPADESPINDIRGTTPSP